MPPIDQQAMLEAIASKQLGAAPAAAAPPPQPGAPPPQPQQRQPSPEEAAATKAAPTTEADQMAKPAVVYEVEFTENDKRKLTPEQIKSTFERYSALNYRNAQLAPVHNVLAKIMQENPGMDPNGLAQKMEAIYKAQASNPTMGQQSPQQQRQQQPTDATPGQSNMDIEAQLAQWEKENAASLPPGYKDMISGTKGELGQIKSQLAQTQQMLAAVLGQSQGVAEAARAGMQQSRQDGMQAVKQQIANNIDRAQQALQLQDDAAQDFMTFSSERGYSLEDFADPMLVFRVMADFRNNMNSPEMERLKAIASRRQAYTGSLSAASPSSGPGGQSMSPTPFDQFADKIMSQKGFA